MNKISDLQKALRQEEKVEKTSHSYWEIVSKKIYELFFPSKKEAEIFHLGGTVNPTFDPTNKGCKLDNKNYFYERIAVKTKDGHIHTYGNSLKEFVEKWMEEVRTGKTEENFQKWMEKCSEEVGVQKKLKEVAVYYFNDLERQQTEVHIGGGSLAQRGLGSDKEGLKPLKGEYAFVVGEFWNESTHQIETKFYATPKIQTEKGKIQHTSFLRGGNVRSAGMFVITDEKQMVHIRNQSGHYKPGEKEMAYLLKHLKESGYDISKIHLQCFRNRFFRFASLYLKIDIKWGVLTQSGETWFEQVGKYLIEEHSH